ncbi:hypothetical protein PanWU01x14_350210 [Parasponia andersonii]|uniref:Uncharacterized protein n=1 Tax=Parasponia andersonii TaxID=3476 RepID=A0A2P5AB42_PARAD|nr:hypothetical protein PanWU01x14_350210 [Parasponia andersonii]
MDSNPPQWGPCPFRFENIWLEHKSFHKDFNSWWNGTSASEWEGHKFLWKLKNIKEKLKARNVEVFEDVRIAKNSLHRRIEVLDAFEGFVS